MRKIPTLFRRAADRRNVIDDVTPGCEWVLAGEGRATRKYDGTCVMLDDDGEWWARREVKAGKSPPPIFVEADHDPETGKTVGWEPVDQSGFVKYLTEALGNPYERHSVGTYELCGPKINGNPEGLAEHVLLKHGDEHVDLVYPLTFGTLRGWMATTSHEGIVWHHPDGRMAKLKRRDFPA